MNEQASELMNEVRRLRKIVWFSVALSSVLAIGLLERPLAAKITNDKLVVRQLSIVDANGIERVRIGAPLPVPIANGKRTKRDEPASGMLIFDAKGNERGGYITDNGAGNALITLDDAKGEDQLTIVSYPDRGAELGLRDHAETRFDVSALNDKTVLKLLHKGTVLLSGQSAK